MAESTISSIADGILGKLGYAGVRVSDGELSGFEETMESIKAKLGDAEEKQVNNHQIKVWLKRLEDSLNEADDLMDEVYNVATKHKFEEALNSNELVSLGRKLPQKIKKIKEKLEKTDDTSSMNLEKRADDHKVFTKELVPDLIKLAELPSDYWISNHVEAIRPLLLNHDRNREEHVPVVAIVGYGGLGKTKVAQYLFNDPNVIRRSHFELRIWVNVPYDFDMKSLVQGIILYTALKDAEDKELEAARKRLPEYTLSERRSAIIEFFSSTPEQRHKANSARLETEMSAIKDSLRRLDEGELHEELRKIIDGKRLLLVLDDVWNMDSKMWLDFKQLLSDAGPGSRILITTRTKVVAEITSTMKVYKLSDLDEYNSWQLFSLSAFSISVSEKEISKIKEIAEEIVKRCGGNPFALQTVGKKLRSIKLETEDWSRFLNAEFQKVVNEETLPSLKLSYDVLPPHLKHCFAYCSIFPQNSEIDVKYLINLWMARGLIYPSPGQQMEDVGYEYLQDLCQRSLFEEVEVDPETGSVTKCKMPNLIQDLAVLVSGTRLAALKEHEKHIIDGRTQHVSFYFHLGSSWKIPTSFLQAKRIRTIILPSQLHWETEGRLSHSTCENIISNCKALRTVDLHNTGIQEVPKSIGKLKYLRYLDLSQNTAIKSLPNSITNIPYLMILKLSSCYGLQELPRDMKKLVHLKHLEIDWCYSLTCMPPGLGQLTQLETLSQFVLNNDTGSAKLNELAGLNNLRGELKIQNLRNEMDTEAANLKGKEHLKSLTLAWEVDENVNAATGDLKTLQGLKPHSNLNELVLFGYRGIEFPDWLISHKNLVKFSLQKCECQYLPPLSQLSSLKVLIVDEMANLKYISNESDIHSSSSTTFMPCLEELRLTELPNLEGWWGDHVSTTDTSLPSFPRLSKLIIEDCPKLRSMPLYPNLKEWLVLDNTSLETFIQTMNDESSSHLSELKSLCIIGIKDTGFDVNIKWECLTKLQFLRFDYLPKLKELPEGLQRVTTLKELHIWRCNIKTLPEWIADSESLKKLGLSTCPYLKSLPRHGLGLSLKTLQIVDCPILLERCQKETGADWEKIDRIENRILQHPQSSLIFKLSKEPAEEKKTLEHQESDLLSKFPRL